jgi:hypothetical protein
MAFVAVAFALVQTSFTAALCNGDISLVVVAVVEIVVVVDQRRIGTRLVHGRNNLVVIFACVMYVNMSQVKEGKLDSTHPQKGSRAVVQVLLAILCGGQRREKGECDENQLHLGKCCWNPWGAWFLGLIWPSLFLCFNEKKSVD